MHRLSTWASAKTRELIGSAIEVHREKGPGLLESIYEWCFAIDIARRKHSMRRGNRAFVDSAASCSNLSGVVQPATKTTAAFSGEGFELCRRQCFLGECGNW